jgi:hypothetical protein
MMYVSYQHRYFITLFGLRGLFDIVLGSGNDASDNPQVHTLYITTYHAWDIYMIYHMYMMAMRDK